jgi:hypothetical protein
MSYKRRGGLIVIPFYMPITDKPWQCTKILTGGYLFSLAYQGPSRWIDCLQHFCKDDRFTRLFKCQLEYAVGISNSQVSKRKIGKDIYRATELVVLHITGKRRYYICNHLEFLLLDETNRCRNMRKPCTHSVFKLVKELKLCGILPENVLNERSLCEMNYLFSFFY